MAQGDPIARGTIEVGANTAPMEAALAGAKDKAVAQAQEIQQAVNSTAAASPQAAVATATTAAAEVAKATDEERYQLALQELATRQEIHRRERVAMEDMRRGTQRLAAAVRPFTQQIQEATQLMGRFAGLSAIFTAATVGAFKLGQVIRQYIVDQLKTGTDKANEFRDALDLTDTEASLRKTKDQIFEISGAIEETLNDTADITPGFFQDPLGVGGITKLKEELRLLKDLEKSLQDTANANRRYNEQQDAIRQQREQIKALRLEIDKLNQTTFSRLEVSVEKIGAYVELLARRLGRDA